MRFNSAGSILKATAHHGQVVLTWWCSSSTSSTRWLSDRVTASPLRMLGSSVGTAACARRPRGSCCRTLHQNWEKRRTAGWSLMNRIDPFFEFSLSLARFSISVKICHFSLPPSGISGPDSGYPISIVVVNRRRPAAQGWASFRRKQRSTHRQRQTCRRKLPWVGSLDWSVACAWLSSRYD